MGLLEVVAPNLAKVVRNDAVWMTWNLFLAWIPVVLGYVLFVRPRPGASLGPGAGPGIRREPLGWWLGVGLFILFLPNAPYVVTDLIHLRDDVLLVGNDWPVITAVLPVYLAFVGAGFLAYYLSLAALGRYLDRNGWAAWRGTITIGVHALCAVGVYLGRNHLTRLNSWEPVVEPRGAFERVVLGLSWRWAPVLIFATFLVTWFGHFVTRAVVEAAWHVVADPLRRVTLGPATEPPR